MCIHTQEYNSCKNVFILSHFFYSIGMERTNNFMKKYTQIEEPPEYKVDHCVM